MNEEKAREILGAAIAPDNSLYASSWDYISWTPGQSKICLDGDFSPDQLSAIIWWMTNKTLA